MVMTEAKNQNPEYSIKKHYSTDLCLAMIVLQLFLKKASYHEPFKTLWTGKEWIDGLIVYM